MSYQIHRLDQDSSCLCRCRRIAQDLIFSLNGPFYILYSTQKPSMPLCKHIV